MADQSAVDWFWAGVCVMMFGTSFAIMWMVFS